jgi:hypothetical protein
LQLRFDLVQPLFSPNMKRHAAIIAAIFALTLTGKP